MPGIHAKLSASGSSRWMACPKSVALERMLPEQESAYAEEGTAAHALAEVKLKAKLGHALSKADKALLESAKSDRDMTYYTDIYVEHCMDLYEESLLKSKNTVAFIEARLDFSKWVPGGFGVGDFVLICDDTIYVRDLKYGKGVPVKAKGNSQLRLYGLGALDDYGWIYDINKVDMGIVQPRLNSMEFEVMSSEELTRWANENVVSAALAADKNKGEFKAGKHCQFCKARAICKHRALSVLDKIKNIMEI